LCLEVGHEPSKILHGALLEASSFLPFVGEICMEPFVSLVYMPHECHTKQYFFGVKDKV